MYAHLCKRSLLQNRCLRVLFARFICMREMHEHECPCACTCSYPSVTIAPEITARPTPSRPRRSPAPPPPPARGASAARRVSPQWHLWVDSLPPKGAIGWNPSEGDVTAMRLMSASGGPPTRAGAAEGPAAEVAQLNRN